MHKKQLHTFAREGFQIYRATEYSGAVVTRAAGGMPLPVWPDGHWCAEVAAYLFRGVEQSLSLTYRGGTLGTYAYELSHLVRYCFNNRCDFINLTDTRFDAFIRGLAAEKVLRNGTLEPKRSENTIIGIGRRSLDFLWFVGNYQGRPNLVGEQGVIKGVLKIVREPESRRRRVPKAYWHHNSLPKPSPRYVRRPIGDNYVGKLRAAIAKMPGSSFLRQRRYVLLRCLEKTGGRRIEIAQLKVSHIEAAVKTAKRGEKPFIQMLTFKKRGGPTKRKVPLNSLELNLLMEFIKYYRAPLLSKKKVAHDFVFVSERSGKPIRANTVTEEIHAMRLCAGITGKASPHLFRHKYITDLMRDFIAEFKVKDKADFLEAAKKLGALKEKVLEYTGHSNAASLETYIDYAFMQVEEVEEAEERVDVRNLAESSQISLEELRLQKDRLPAEELAKLAMRHLEAIHRDLSRGRTTKREQGE